MPGRMCKNARREATARNTAEMIGTVALSEAANAAAEGNLSDGSYISVEVTSTDKSPIDHDAVRAWLKQHSTVNRGEVAVRYNFLYPHIDESYRTTLYFVKQPTPRRSQS